MKKLKCEKCGKTLLMIEYGKLEIKCPRCGKISRVEIRVTSDVATR
jgi:phage FluMu protein Com